MSGLLGSNQISVDVFLNGMVCNSNKIFENCRFHGEIVADTNSDSDSAEDDSQSQPQANGVITGATCLICYHNPSDVLLSCGHNNNCITCFNKMKEVYDKKMIAYELGRLDYEPKFKYAVSSVDITAHMHVPKIFS